MWQNIIDYLSLSWIYYFFSLLFTICHVDHYGFSVVIKFWFLCGCRISDKMCAVGKVECGATVAKLTRNSSFWNSNSRKVVDSYLFLKQYFFTKNFKKMWYLANFVVGIMKNSAIATFWSWGNYYAWFILTYRLGVDKFFFFWAFSILLKLMSSGLCIFYRHFTRKYMLFRVFFTCKWTP